jgi:hypothetical protein
VASTKTEKRILPELCRAYFSREDALLLLLFAHMLQILKKRKRQICAVMKNHRRRSATKSVCQIKLLEALKEYQSWVGIYVCKSQKNGRKHKAIHSLLLGREKK